MLRQGVNGFHGCLHLHSFKSLMLYSTSSSSSVASKSGIANPLMVDYLAKSLGFSEDEAITILSNTKVSPRLKSTEKSQLVVDFLKNIGFDGTHIRKVIASAPNVLFSDVEKTLNPKIRVFQDLGFSGSDLGLIISQQPSVLKRSLEGHIIPALEILKSLMGSDELVTFLLKTKAQILLSNNVLKYLPDNLLLLQSYGLPSDKIKRFIVRRPLFLLQRTQWVEKIVKGTEDKLGIPRTSGMFLHGVSALSMTSEKKLESMTEVFRSYGWREIEIFSFLRKQPLHLTLSEETLRVKLKYLMEDLGFGIDYLITYPPLLAFSIEKKIVPRTAVMRALKEKQLVKRDVSVYTILSMPESKFVERYLLPVKDKLPELFEYYTRTTGASLPKT